MDHILAGIVDITQNLQNTSPNLPLAPLTNSQSTALDTLMMVLHGTVPPIAAPTILPEPPSAQATPLRVLPTSNTSLPPPAIPAPHYIPLDDDSPKALRVSLEPIALSMPTAPPSGPVLIPLDHDDVTAPTSNHHQHQTP